MLIWRRARETVAQQALAAGLEPIAYRNPYQLRHTVASQLLSQGENSAYIARLLGHKPSRWFSAVTAGRLRKARSWGLTAHPAATAWNPSHSHVSRV